MVTVNVTENRTVIMATAATTHRADIALDPVATTVDIDTVIAKDTALVGAITDIDRKPWHYKIESPQDAGVFLSQSQRPAARFQGAHVSEPRVQSKFRIDFRQARLQ